MRAWRISASCLIVPLGFGTMAAAAAKREVVGLDVQLEVAALNPALLRRGQPAVCACVGGSVGGGSVERAAWRSGGAPRAWPRPVVLTRGGAQLLIEGSRARGRRVLGCSLRRGDIFVLQKRRTGVCFCLDLWRGGARL